MDLFDQKIALFPLEKYLPEYKDQSVDSPKQYVANLYLSKVKSGSTRRKSSASPASGDSRSAAAKKVFHHFTCATDTGQIKVIFQDVTEIIIEKTLRENHLL